jgi:2,3-dihydro-2,3-dihydroxybenzoate dehydrogenase
MAELKDRRLIVTGGASGIGAATAQLARAAGARVAILDQDEVAGDLAWRVDVSDAAQVERAVAVAAEALGGIDGLVNAAGVSGRSTLEATDPAIWRRLFEVNVMGSVNVTAACVPHLRSQGRGSIVNLSSGTALKPFPAIGPYVASKSGVIAMTKVWAMELGPDIRVNVICPGAIETPMITRGYVTPESRAELAQLYALKRLGRPEEVANAICFLLSDEASFITGVTLPVDGGRTFH